MCALACPFARDWRSARLPQFRSRTNPAVAGAQAQADAAVSAKVKDRSVRYGRALVVTGRVASGEPGVALTLEFRPRGGAWAVGGARPLRHRWRLPPQGAGPPLRRGPCRGRTGGAVVRAAEAASAPTSSAAERVTVVAALRMARTRLHVMAGRRALVRGVVRGARSGRKVSLQLRTRRGWTTVARTRTGRRGAFRIRYAPGRMSSAQARVRVAGDRDLGGTRRRVGRLNVYRRAHASWYGPGLYGNALGCGGRLGGTLGVAHKTLPCGTR